MKIKTWLVNSYHPSVGFETKILHSEDEARAEYRRRLEHDWEMYKEGPFPSTVEEAKSKLDDLDGVPEHSIDIHELELTPRNCPPLSLELEAALCAWEHILDNAAHEPWVEWLDGIGYAGMRHCSMQAGSIALTVYELMEAKGLEHHDAYDWEFVPEVVIRLDWDKLVNHNQYAGEAYEPDLEAILADIMKQRPDSFHDRWIEDAKAAGRKLWGYEGLTDDHPGLIDRSQTPETWVKELGEELELIPASTW
jgi:hypothetical protein